MLQAIASVGTDTATLLRRLADVLQVTGNVHVLARHIECVIQRGDRLHPTRRVDQRFPRAGIGAACLEVQQRGHDLDVILDAVLKLAHQQLIAAGEFGITLGALDQPVDQQAIEAGDQDVHGEREQPRVTAGTRRLRLRQEKKPRAEPAEDHRQDTRSEPAEQGRDDDRRENRDERYPHQALAEAQTYSDRDADGHGADRIGQQRNAAQAPVPGNQVPADPRQDQPCRAAPREGPRRVRGG
jgi:hypothetical protein